MISEALNINYLWTSLIVEELARWNIRDYFIAPGSRSTPLVSAIAHSEKANSYVHFDERGTAFAALGYAKSTGAPAVWVTTSGTAVANGLPAVIEAHMEGVPLILLTADRPPELRQTGANQSINQFNIFAPYVKWQIDAPAPTTAISPRFVLTSIDHAVHRALTQGKGPVHLNWMFREPLAPEQSGEDFREYLAEVRQWMEDVRPFTSYVNTSSTHEIDPIPLHDLKKLLNSRKGVVIGGRLKSKEEADAVVELAVRLGWPILPDISSQIRIGHSKYDKIEILSPLLFTSENVEHTPIPDVVLQVGKRPASKQVATWLNSIKGLTYIVVDDYSDRLDPFHHVSYRFEAKVGQVVRLLDNMQGAADEDNDWNQQWQHVNNEVKANLDQYWQKNEQLSEPAVARMLSEQIGEDHVLVAGNSMPIRDLDTYSAYRSHAVRTITNRGASGIDGLIATAVGTAIGTKKAVTVLAGDLSLLHDLNSLAMAGSLKTSFVLVVINNNGGGIFSFLPIVGYKDIFETYFGTPHGFSFGDAARMFGAAYLSPSTVDDFRRQYTRAINTSGFSIIEVKTDRQENYKEHKKIEAFVRIGYV